MIAKTKKEHKLYLKYIRALTSIMKKLRHDFVEGPDAREVAKTEAALEQIHKQRKKIGVKKGTHILKKRG